MTGPINLIPYRNATAIRENLQRGLGIALGLVQTEETRLLDALHGRKGRFTYTGAAGQEEHLEIYVWAADGKPRDTTAHIPRDEPYLQVGRGVIGLHNVPSEQYVADVITNGAFRSLAEYSQIEVID